MAKKPLAKPDLPKRCPGCNAALRGSNIKVDLSTQGENVVTQISCNKCKRLIKEEAYQL